MAYLIPALFLSAFSFALFKRVKLYDCFLDGVKGAVPLLVRLFPYLAAILILSELFSVSGLDKLLLGALAPLFRALGIPQELAPLVLLKPFSGSGSLALLGDILSTYGADSYLGRCACAVYGSADTVFYLSALYFSSRKQKNLLPVLVALFANFCSVLLAFAVCKLF